MGHPDVLGGLRTGNSKSKSNDNGKDNGKSEIRGSFDCGGKCAAFAQDDEDLWVGEREQATARAKAR
jgi:hypothetical protein